MRASSRTSVCLINAPPWRAIRAPPAFIRRLWLCTPTLIFFSSTFFARTHPSTNASFRPLPVPSVLYASSSSRNAADRCSTLRAAGTAGARHGDRGHPRKPTLKPPTFNLRQFFVFASLLLYCVDAVPRGAGGLLRPFPRSWLRSNGFVNNRRAHVRNRDSRRRDSRRRSPSPRRSRSRSKSRSRSPELTDQERDMRTVMVQQLPRGYVYSSSGLA